MLWCICLPACFPCGFCAFNQLFMTKVPEHWCNIPQLANFSSLQRKRIGIPTHDGTVENCARYAVNWTDILDVNDINNFEPNTSWPVELCKDGWEYNKSEVSSSIVIDVSKQT